MTIEQAIRPVAASANSAAAAIGSSARLLVALSTCVYVCVLSQDWTQHSGHDVTIEQTGPVAAFAKSATSAIGSSVRLLVADCTCAQCHVNGHIFETLLDDRASCIASCATPEPKGESLRHVSGVGIEFITQT